MTEFKKNGLVIQERDYGENDKILTILTERYGKVPVIAKGVKSVRNRHMASCQLFSYATFGLRKSGNFYVITESDLIENYFDIRNDINKLSLAAFICDVVNDVAQEGNNEDAILKLALNTLYAISKELKPLEFIRASFELRVAVECGFAPNLDLCSSCFQKNIKSAYFDIVEGVIICEKCKKTSFYTSVENEFSERGLLKPIAIISFPVLCAMRYIISCKQERFLSFNLEQTEQLSFYDICEKFLLHQLERGFYSLDFYKSIL